MPKLLLHLDADTSIKVLNSKLRELGHDVTRTPNDWMPLDASDEKQLLEATVHERAIFTFNIRDFMFLDKNYPQHKGIIVAAQNSWSLADLINSLDYLLSSTSAEELSGQLRWLNQWKK